MATQVPFTAVATAVAAQALSMLGWASLDASAGDEPPAATAVGRGNVPAAGSVAERPPLEQIDRSLRHGAYEDAESASRIALAAMEASGDGKAELSALYADRLVEALLEGGKWKRPETLARARFAVATKEQTLGPDSVETAGSLQWLGRVLTRHSAYPEARGALDRSLHILERSLGPESPDVALVRQSIGRVYFAQGQYASATTWFEQALAIREKVLGPDDPEVADTLRMLGDCAKQQNDQPTALQLLRKSQAISERALGSRHPDVAMTLNSLGETLRQAGDYAQAKAILEEAVVIFEQALGADSPLVAMPLTALGAVLSDMGDFPAAERVLERAMDIRIREYGHSDKNVATTINDLGIVQLQLGNYPEAARRFRECGAIAETLFGPWHPNVAAYVDNLAIALASSGRYAEAEPLFARSLEIRTRNFGNDNQAVAHSLVNLAAMNGDLGEYAKQKDYAQRALATLERLGDTNGWLIGSALSSLATAARGLGEADEAVTYSARAVATMDRAFGRFHPEVARALAVHAHMLVESGQREAGLTAAIESESLSREHLELTVQTATERDALAYASTRPSTIGLLVSMANSGDPGDPSIPSTAWDHVIRARALVLDALTTRRRLVIQNQDAEITRLRDELSGATERLAKLVVAGPAGSDADSFRQQVLAAREQRNRAERALAARSEEFREHIALSHAGLGEIRAASPDEMALVAFVRYGHVELQRTTGAELPGINDSKRSYAAFVLGAAHSAPIVVKLGEAATIDALVDRWRSILLLEAPASGAAARASEAAYRRAATELRRAIWDPIAPHLSGANEVLVVPDGAVHLVNLAALPVDDGQYVIERGPRLHYLSAERDLLKPEVAAVSGGLLALGNPDFNDRALFASLGAKAATPAPAAAGTVVSTYRGLRSACGSLQAMTFEPLAASAREVEQIVDFWKGATDGAAGVGEPAGRAGEAVSYSGPAASEAAFKRRASGHRVLHLATHGFFLGGQCRSALEDAGTTTGEPAAVDITRESPLLLSGLAMAGANHRAVAGADEDDGILTAEEISMLDLRSTEWAVLSACDTGAGEIRAGEGVFGLRRAFQMAGARTVIMSLWPVEDEATRQWMAALYRHRFSEGKSTIESVNDASRELLQRRRMRGESTHPFYWAGFIAAGDWR